MTDERRTAILARVRHIEQKLRSIGGQYPDPNMALTAPIDADHRERVLSLVREWGRLQREWWGLPDTLPVRRGRKR